MYNWYAYIYGSPLLPESYYLMSVKPEYIYGTSIVAIYAKGTGVHPDNFSPKFKTQIANAIGTGRDVYIGPRKSKVSCK